MPAKTVPARVRTPRHRAVRRPTVVLSDLIATAACRVATARRRSAVMVASSGLIMSMVTAPASATPAESHLALADPAQNVAASALLASAPPVQVAANDAWRFDSPVLTVANCRAHLPAYIGGYHGEQIVNAAQIIMAGKALRLNTRGQTIAVMTAIGESTLTNVDFGDGAGPDSRGLFQQRANGAWGSYSDRMDPRTAAKSFIKGLLRVPGWENMRPTIAAHTVQRNANPNHYEKFWYDAVLIVRTLDSDPNLATKLPAKGVKRC